LRYSECMKWNQLRLKCLQKQVGAEGHKLCKVIYIYQEKKNDNDNVVVIGPKHGIV